MKLQKVSQSMSSFAGISFVHEEFNKRGLLQLIDQQIGKHDGTNKPNKRMEKSRNQLQNIRSILHCL